MKKILLLLSFFAIASVLSAQVQQKNWLLGGSASFYHDKYGNEKETGLTVSPDVGYFFIDKLAGGLRVNLSTWTNKEEGYNDYKGTDFSIAPFVRYYFLPARQKINIFAEGSYQYGTHTYDYGGESGKQTENVHTFAFQAGPAIFFTPHTALEITVGYNNEKWESDDDATHSIQMAVGFQIHFGGK
jgi:hypothetical protein